jgi:hypothetical protein
MGKSSVALSSTICDCWRVNGKYWGASKCVSQAHDGQSRVYCVGFGQQLADLITTASTLDEQSLCDVMKSLQYILPILLVVASVSICLC